MTASAVYVGRIQHRRRTPRHGFRHRLYMLLLDLDELPDLFDGIPGWSARRPALARFRREDHLGDPAVPLSRAVRDLVQARTGRRPEGPIRLLTHLRYFGYVFNPASFYYCLDPSGARVEQVVVEVTNTPWNERYAYVLDAADGERRGGGTRHGLDKRFHVSPFQPMTSRYRWTFSPPADRLVVAMESFEKGQRAFDASLVLRRRPWSRRELTRVLIAHPPMTFAVTAWIYLQAFRLWARGARFHTHPGNRSGGVRRWEEITA